MNILSTVIRWLKPTMKTGSDGLYNFVDVRNHDGLLELADQITRLPDNTSIDIDWLTSSIFKLKDQKSIDEFVEIYQKISMGKKMHYENDPIGLIAQIKKIQPNVRWLDDKAVGYNSEDNNFK